MHILIWTIFQISSFFSLLFISSFNNSHKLSNGLDYENASIAELASHTSFELPDTTKFINQNCSDCDFVIKNNAGAFDGVKMGVKPGDIICLSGNIKYKQLIFTNITADLNNPVTIKNCNGRAIIKSMHTYGILFQNCKGIVLTGNGDSSYMYGIKASTREGFFIAATHFSTDLEIAYLEVAGYEKNGIGKNDGFAGISVKTKPYCDGSANKGVWLCENISIHHNYIHDTGGEGMYIGHGFNNGRKEPGCNKVTYSHSIHNLKVYNNIVMNTGYDGIQIKNADKNTEIYNNIIYNFATKNIATQGDGLYIGEGTTGRVYNNYIEKGTGAGINYRGIGNSDLFNNITYNCDGYGLYAAEGYHAYRLNDGYFNFSNNSFIKSGKGGMVFYGDNGGDKIFVNNLIVGAEEDLFSTSANDFVEERNIKIQGIENEIFLNYTNKNFRPSKISPTIDAGMDFKVFTPKYDADNKHRSSDKIDVGAYEYDKD